MGLDHPTTRGEDAKGQREQRPRPECVQSVGPNERIGARVGQADWRGIPLTRHPRRGE